MTSSKISEKVKKIKSLDPKSKIFQVYQKTHKQYIKEFEEKFNIILPYNFREFLINVSSGIEYRERSTINIMDNIKFWELTNKEANNNPSIKFELTTRITEFEGEPHESEYYPYSSDIREFQYDSFSNGIIPILDVGCGSNHFIVVNGPELGNIWCNNYMSNSEIFPLFDKELGLNRIGFNFWINKQLDSALNYLS